MRHMQIVVENDDRPERMCLDDFLRAFPRSLEQRPRITRRSGHREWMDTSLGSWPANAVAKAWTRGRNPSDQIQSV